MERANYVNTCLWNRGGRVSNGRMWETSTKEAVKSAWWVDRKAFGRGAVRAGPGIRTGIFHVNRAGEKEHGGRGNCLGKGTEM